VGREASRADEFERKAKDLEFANEKLTRENQAIKIVSQYITDCTVLQSQLGERDKNLQIALENIEQQRASLIDLQAERDEIRTHNRDMEVVKSLPEIRLQFRLPGLVGQGAGLGAVAAFGNQRPPVSAAIFPETSVVV
jgi:hypothetical protein